MRVHVIDISPSPMMSVDLALALDVGGQAPRATATSLARAPIVTTTRSATVTAVVATATGTGYVAAAFVPSSVAIRAVASALAYAPVVTGHALVAAPIAAATTRAIAPVNPLNVTVNAVIANGTSYVPSPIVLGEAVLTGGGPGTASTSAIIPTVTVSGATTPSVNAIGTPLAQTSANTAAVPVPAGVASGQIILVFIRKSNLDVVTPPAGFAELLSTPTAAIFTGTQFQTLNVFWKRATGADSGTYSFTWTNAIARAAQAISISGCVASGSPIDVQTANGKATTTDGLTPDVSMGTTLANDLLVWAATGWNGGSCSTATGMTEISDPGVDFGIAIDTLAFPTAGGTGTISATWTNAGSTLAWLGALRL